MIFGDIDNEIAGGCGVFPKSWKCKVRNDFERSKLLVKYYKENNLISLVLLCIVLPAIMKKIIEVKNLIKKFKEITAVSNLSFSECLNKAALCGA